MIPEQDRVGQVIPEAMKASKFFKRLPDNIREGYTARFSDIFRSIELHSGGRWNTITILEIGEFLDKHPTSDGRHPVDSLKKDLVTHGYAISYAGAEQAVQNVFDTSIRMLRLKVLTYEDFIQRKRGLYRSSS